MVLCHNKFGGRAVRHYSIVVRQDPWLAGKSSGRVCLTFSRSHFSTSKE
jgi:hypothetical protein